MEKIDHADHTDGHYRGKRSSTLFEGDIEDELLAKKERINPPETASDDDEFDEINVVDTSDNEAEFSLKCRLERQSLSSTSPVCVPHLNFVHKSVIKSNSLDEEVDMHLQLERSNRHSIESPLDLSYKNSSCKGGAIYFGKNNCERSRKTESKKFSPDQNLSLDSPGDVRFAAGDLTFKGHHKECTSQQMVRRSVIKSSDQDLSFPDVEDHFRRSLGRHTFAAFSQPKVEDHFARALGNAWPSNGDVAVKRRTESSNHF